MYYNGAQLFSPIASGRADTLSRRRDLIDLNRDELRKKYVAGFYKKGTIKDDAPLPLRAWWYLREQAEAFMHEDDAGDPVVRLNALSAAMLEDFRVIVITLDDTDDAQVIFETLNSGGEPLAAMDLVRNDVFTGQYVATKILKN